MNFAAGVVIVVAPLTGLVVWVLYGLYKLEMQDRAERRVGETCMCDYCRRCVADEVSNAEARSLEEIAEDLETMARVKGWL